MTEILEMPLGLTMGLINEKSNQYDKAMKESKKKKDKKNDEVIEGTAEMLKR